MRFYAFGRSNFPIDDVFDVIFGDIELVAISEGTLEKDSDGNGQFGDSGIVKFVEVIVFVGFISNCKRSEETLIGIF